MFHVTIHGFPEVFERVISIIILIYWELGKILVVIFLIQQKT